MLVLHQSGNLSFFFKFCKVSEEDFSNSDMKCQDIKTDGFNFFLAMKDRNGSRFEIYAIDTRWGNNIEFRVGDQRRSYGEAIKQSSKSMIQRIGKMVSKGFSDPTRVHLMDDDSDEKEEKEMNPEDENSLVKSFKKYGHQLISSYFKLWNSFQSLSTYMIISHGCFATVYSLLNPAKRKQKHFYF